MDRIADTLDLIDADFPATLEALKRYLRVPGISMTGEGIQESAALTLSILAGLADTDVRIEQSAGNPVVLGTTRSPDPGARTLLFYCFYDVVPATPADWVTPPFEPTVMPAGAIGLDAHHGPVLVGRGAADHRGPLIAAVQAVRAMQAAGGLPVNILWLVEGEEEIGSPSLGAFVARHQDELARADAFWVPRMSRVSDSGAMLVHRAWKGQMWLYLTIKSGAWGGALDGQDLWAANLNWVDSPMWRLTRAVATLVDAEDRIAIDGFWEHVVPAGPQEEAELASLLANFDEAEAARSVRVGRFKGGQSGRDLLRRYVLEPQLNLGQGVLPGAPDNPGRTKGLVDGTLKTELAMQAYARLDIRLVPRLEQDIVIGLLRAHLDRRGYPEIDIVKARPGYSWAHTDPSIGLYRSAARAAASRGIPMEVWPIIPSTAPMNFFNRPPLNLPLIGCGAGHGAWWHQANEYVSVEGVREFGKFFAVWMHEWAREPPDPAGAG